MPHPAPILDEPGRQRWSEAFNRLIRTSRVDNLAELARELKPAISLKESTLKSELTRLRDGDPATLGRWLERPERWEALARELELSAAALSDELARAARPQVMDAWEALFPDGDAPPPLPTRLRELHPADALGAGERGATRIVEGWIAETRRWAAQDGRKSDERLRVALAAWPGGGVEVALESLRRAVAAAGLGERVDVERAPPDDPPRSGGSPCTLVLDLAPWGPDELRAIATLLEARGAARAVLAQIRAFATEVERAPLAHESLMSPRRVLTWARDRLLRPGTPAPSLGRLLGEQALGACAELGKGRLLDRLGLGFLCQLFAEWRLGAPVGNPWPARKRSQVVAGIEAAIRRARPERPGSDQIGGLLDRLERAPDDERGALVAALRGALDLAPDQVFELLVRGGVLTQPKTSVALPADPALAEALAAIALVEDGQLHRVLHPRFATLLHRMAGEGLRASDLLDAVEQAPPHQTHLACQAAACALGAAVLPDDDDVRARIASVWAGAVASLARGTGRSVHPGYIVVGTTPEDDRVVRSLLALSERGRDWLPELGASGLQAAIEPLAPDAVRRLAELWDEGLPPLSPHELDRHIAALAPWQLDVLAPEAGAVLEVVRYWTRVDRILDWRLDRGEPRALRLAVGLDGLGEGLDHVRARWLYAQARRARLRLAARVPADEAEIIGLVRGLTPGLLHQTDWDDAALVELLAPLLGRLAGEHLVRWMGEALLHAHADPHLHHRFFIREGTPALSDDNPLSRMIRGQGQHERAVAVLLGVAERLGMRALLAWLADGPTAALADPAGWPALLSWPRHPDPLPRLHFKLRERAIEALNPLERLDRLAGRAAEALCRLGDPEPLRARWRAPLVFPELLVHQAAQRALITLASAAGDAVLSRCPPPAEAALGEPLTVQSALDARQWTQRWWHVAGRAIEGKEVSVAAEAAIRCLDALTARAEREVFELSAAELDWLARVILEQDAPELGGHDRWEARRMLRWPVDLARQTFSFPREEDRWPLTRQAEAADRLRAALDPELIRVGLDLLLDQHNADTDARQLARDRITRQLSKDAELAERAWELASPELRCELPWRVLESERAPRIDALRWAQRAAAMDVERAGTHLLHKVTGPAALAIGLPWISREGSPILQLRRALQIHERAPWPEPLAPLLRRWSLDEPAPFGAPGIPFEEDWDRVAGDALKAVEQAVAGGGSLRVAELRQGVERLWRLAIALPVSVRERGAFLRSWEAEPVSTLCDLLVKLDHIEPLKQAFLDPPAPQDGDERWWGDAEASVHERGHDRPSAARALLIRPVLAHLDARDLRALVGGAHAGGALLELLRRGDRRTLDRCDRLIAASPRLDHDAVWSPVDPDFPVPWLLALFEICNHRPGRLIELYRGWLRQAPGARPALLRALAGWAAPPDPVPGVEGVLNEELERLMRGRGET